MLCTRTGRKKRQKKTKKKKKKKQFSNLFKNVFFICLLYFIYLYLHLLYDVVFGVLPIYVVIILISFFFNTFTIQLFRSDVQFLFSSQILTTLVAKLKKIKKNKTCTFIVNFFDFLWFLDQLVWFPCRLFDQLVWKNSIIYCCIGTVRVASHYCFNCLFFFFFGVVRNCFNCTITTVISTTTIILGDRFFG